MAQDFAFALGLDSNGRRIDLIDADGMSLACIQTLCQRMVALKVKVAALHAAAASRIPESAVGGTGNEPDAP